MKTIFVSKILAVSILGFMLWLTLQCPCKRLLCCHLGTFWISLVALIAIVLYENGFKLIDESCRMFNKG